MIFSFGYDGAGPPPGVSKVFDVRELTHNEHDPAFKDAITQMIEYVQAHPKESVAIGCQKGQHRSRVIAHQAAMRLRTSVFHRE